MEALKEFSLVSGLKLNLAKCGIVIKGDLPPDALAAIQQSGIKIVNSVRYRVVKMGNISSKDAFAASMAESAEEVEYCLHARPQPARKSANSPGMDPSGCSTHCKGLLPRPGCHFLTHYSIQYNTGL